MNKGKITVIAGIVAIVLIAGGALVFGGKDDKAPNSSNPTSDSTSTAPSDSSEEDLGLCKIIDKDAAKVALGEAAVNLSGPNDTGVTGLGDGDKGQTCVYPFAEGGDVTNSFYTDLAVYSQESFDQISSFTATSGEPVSGVGDKAVYESNDSVATNSKEFTITAIKGTKVYIFAISQPKDAVTFDDATALAALTAIAQSANL
ncbi:hypothetical protein H0X10_04285 [Candidatus Saccharibacteria bacterium]|nr:hypothetical protein [Candidatus Saccharibacteria bacterium]